MSKKYLCAMAGFDPETSARLKALETLLGEQGFSGKQTKNIPMHFTLGAFDMSEEAAALGAIKHAASEIKPFKVVFSHLGVFGGSRVLFVCPDPCEELLKLKNAVKPEAFWSPHATILIDEPERIYQALPIAAKAIDGGAFGEPTATVTEIHLYEFQPPRHIATVKLG